MTTNDTFFLSYEEAYKEAVKREEKILSIAFKCPALCYYYSDTDIEHDLDNLIAVPKGKAKEFFLSTNYRIPTHVFCSMKNEDSKQQAQSIANDIAEFMNYNTQQTIEMVKLCRLTPPHPDKSKLRVLGFASKMTTVLQYNCKSLLDALEKAGCLVKLSIQDSLYKDINGYQGSKDIIEFQPHVILSFNTQCGEYIHPNTINVTWWQDLTSFLVSDNKYPFRYTDICMYIPPLNQYLDYMGCTKMYQQDSLIDTNIFNTYIPKETRKPKLVIVASNYVADMTSKGWQDTYDYLYDVLENENSHVVTYDLLNHLSNLYEVPANDILWYIYPQVVRKITVLWMCQCNDLIDVEVYGRNWEKEPYISEFFKGEVPHGKNVADVYNNATHALVTHGFLVASQRLMESTACGCIPIVFDSRLLSAKEHWDNHCVWFSNYESLRNAIRNKDFPKQDPSEVATHYTYDVAAKRLIDNISGLL